VYPQGERDALENFYWPGAGGRSKNG